MKIIQLITWNDKLLGLGDDGVTYELGPDGHWLIFVPPLDFESK